MRTFKRMASLCLMLLLLLSFPTALIVSAEELDTGQEASAQASKCPAGGMCRRGIHYNNSIMNLARQDTRTATTTSRPLSRVYSQVDRQISLSP